jgi:small subunit ribosomal protein S6e
MKSCHKCFKPRRKGFKKKKSVRGSIVANDIKNIQLCVMVEGEKPIPGLTDVEAEKRLGPKRANKLRKFYGADRKADATKLVIRRSIQKGDKVYYKAPKVQRLITSARLRRKKVLRRNKMER